MSRKKVRAPEGVSNPIQEFLGVYLRLRRKQVGIDVAYMARVLGLTPTYYRLIEAGQCVLGGGCVPSLIRALESREVYIDFASLATVLLGITILGKSLTHLPDSWDQFHALEDFSDFKKLLGETAPYLSLPEGAERRAFLETKAYYAMRDFLETSPGQREHKYPYLKLDDVSPHGVKMLTDLHRELAGRHFMGEQPAR